MRHEYVLIGFVLYFQVAGEDIEEEQGLRPYFNSESETEYKLTKSLTIN